MGSSRIRTRVSKLSVGFFLYMCYNAINWRYDNSNDGTDIVAESSKPRKDDDDFSDDPFQDVVSKNVMPIPTEVKKEYLEDYENFTVA